MAIITYKEHNGQEHVVDVENGKTVMQGAVDHFIEGIIGECGGCCSCATCHVIVEDEWFVKIGGPNDTETEMLEAVPEPTPTSRLSCQITVTDDLDGLVLQLPDEQF